MELDQVFRRFAISQGTNGTMIACLYTGRHFPGFCMPMPRDPAPATGMLLNDEFYEHVGEAIKLNPSIHDGAIMSGRSVINAPYKVTGWSFRLFAPGTDQISPVNRGSAFNSCHAFAQEQAIDRVYLHSAGKMHLFIKGTHNIIYDGLSSK